jgi:hypothetical protein
LVILVVTSILPLSAAPVVNNVQNAASNIPQDLPNAQLRKAPSL